MSLSQSERSEQTAIVHLRDVLARRFARVLVPKVKLCGLPSGDKQGPNRAPDVALHPFLRPPRPSLGRCPLARAGGPLARLESPVVTDGGERFTPYHSLVEARGDGDDAVRPPGA